MQSFGSSQRLAIVQNPLHTDDIKILHISKWNTTVLFTLSSSCKITRTICSGGSMAGNSKPLLHVSVELFVLVWRTPNFLLPSENRLMESLYEHDLVFTSYINNDLIWKDAHRRLRKSIYRKINNQVVSRGSELDIHS